MRSRQVVPGPVVNLATPSSASPCADVNAARPSDKGKAKPKNTCGAIPGGEPGTCKPPARAGWGRVRSKGWAVWDAAQALPNTAGNTWHASVPWRYGSQNSIPPPPASPNHRYPLPSDHPAGAACVSTSSKKCKKCNQESGGRGYYPSSKSGCIGW